jgi:Zn-finger nucleic acid-binding protein
MDCPRCHQPLNKTPVDEVIFDRCGVCGGLWLDFAQLDDVLARESRSLHDLLPKHAPAVADDTAPAACPRCIAPLIRMRASPEPLTYYACLTCYGRWLDGHQIERIVGRPLAAKFEKLFQRLFE